MSNAGAVRRLVVVGGGPSGLAAAWKASVVAERAGAALQIVVFEADREVGGKARTEQAADLLLETGPQGFLDDQPVLREMIEACGLANEVLAPEPAANRRYIYRGGKLRLLSRSPAAFVRSGLLGPLGLARLAMEPLVPARRTVESRAGSTGAATVRADGEAAVQGVGHAGSDVAASKRTAGDAANEGAENGRPADASDGRAATDGAEDSRADGATDGPATDSAATVRADGGAADDDESLFDFAARRLGRQAARRLISPVALGIFAGDARNLSAAAAFPRLVAMEQAHGSLFKAMRAGRKRGVPPAGHRTFVRGIGSLPRAVAALPGIEIRCNRRVTAIERRGGEGFIVTVSADDDTPSGVGRRAAVSASAGAGREPRPDQAAEQAAAGPRHDQAPEQTASATKIAADAVVLATDLPAAADLAEGVSAQAAHELRQIESPPMAVVHTAFEAAAAAHIEPAYGFLVARGEGVRMLGCQYETATFRGRAPEGTFLARSLFGGSVDPEAPSLSDEQLIDLTLAELRLTAGIDANPTFTSVARWPHAIPQYAPGHLQRATRIEAALEPIAGFHLAGNALFGVGLSRAIAVGADCGEKAARRLLGA